MTYWEWAIIIVLLAHTHYQVMKNKKSISNLFCILEDHNINITRVFKPLTLWEAWSGDMIDPPPLEGTDERTVLEAFKRERAEKERRVARRNWWGLVIFGAVIAAFFIFSLWLGR